MSDKVLHCAGDGSYMIWCPGCNCGHQFYVEKKSPIWCMGCRGSWKEGGPEKHFPKCTGGAKMGPFQWTFNGNFDKPTFSPSLQYPGRCHFNLIDGQLHFCADCNHPLANKVVPLEPFPEDK